MFAREETETQAKIIIGKMNKSKFTTDKYQSHFTTESSTDVVEITIIIVNSA